ncbi:uncharacterized protein LOC132947104 [Metopolophium dirhodum]|uniref:uncharacterized protein LOC132947104 n=1 Tax=Metopolophium dirhodum TaxID=44670 RepID=UPI0029900D49|nr:uncharacterized protein LOC132947104 [Metopolophium dirhodum]
MILPYAALVVFAFTVTFDSLNLYSLVVTAFDNIIFETCQQCLESDCHLKDKRPCITRYWEKFNFTCYTCYTNDDGVRQYYSEDECNTACTDPAKKCVCDFECYICIDKELGNLKNWTRCNHYRVEEPTCV